MQILHNINFNSDIKDSLKKILEKKGIKTSQKGIHFGKNCLINIPDNVLNEIKNQINESDYTWQYRNKKTFIENQDILEYKKGDKICIEYLETDFFPVKNEKGTVLKIEEYNIMDFKKIKLTIRAYKKKNKGWFVETGDNCRIKRGW